MSILLHSINKPLSIRISNKVINRSFVRSSKFNALVFPLPDQQYLGYPFYHIIKRFSGSKKAASEATKIISENIPHSSKPALPKNILSSSVPSSHVSSTKTVMDPHTNKPQVTFVKNFNSVTEKPEIIRNNILPQVIFLVLKDLNSSKEKALLNTVKKSLIIQLHLT